jgi:hypothetical protein
MKKNNKIHHHNDHSNKNHTSDPFFCKKVSGSQLVSGGFIFTLGLFSLFFSSCAPHTKQPIPNIEEFRKNALEQHEKGPAKVEIVERPTIVKVPEIHIQEQSKVDPFDLLIKVDPLLNFVEGVPTTFEFSVHHKIPGLTSSLSSKNLPKGMTITKKTSSSPSTQNSNTDIYEIKWTPDSGFIGSQQIYKLHKIQLEAQSSSTNPKLKHLVSFQEVSFLVTRQNISPRDLKIDNLAETLKTNTVIRFKVTVNVPGFNEQSPDRPLLIISPDPLVYTPGVQTSWDASRHVKPVSHQSVTFNKKTTRWEFDLILDTQNIKPQTETFPADMVMLLQVFNPYGLSTPPATVKFKLEN